MSDPQTNPVIDKITELYAQFQHALGTISHEHLESSKQTIGTLDQACQTEIRKKIDAEKPS